VSDEPYVGQVLLSVPQSVPYRTAPGCPEYCGALRCGRVAGHDGLHETWFNAYAITWPVDPPEAT
jgi:hypothetical protein